MTGTTHYYASRNAKSQGTTYKSSFCIVAADLFPELIGILMSGITLEINLVNFYTSFVIYSKSALYKIHIAFKEQIRNKTVFFYNSVFFSFHLISFFALGNI